ncbi:MAG: type II CAAX endopeptidase family protein [Candidatus Omnitrophota bacterium]|nr:type II CAAX endopeptidase family protein [Candidatus Omnitrophota bacterium]
MKRSEILLLTAIALAWGAQAVWVHAPSIPETRASSWKEQEKKTRSEIRRTMETDRSKLEAKLRANPSLWWRFQGLMFGLVLMGVGVLIQWGRLLFRAAPEPPLGSPAPATWGFRQIFRLVLGILLVIQCSILFQIILFRLVHPPWLDRRVGALIDTLLVDAVAAAGAGWLLFRGRIGRWDPSKIPAAVGAALRSYLFAVPLLVGVLLAVAAVLNLLKIEPPPQPIFTMYLSEERTSVVRVLLLLAVVAGPIAEEIFFRGLLYGWLRQRIGIRNGLVISALFFALLHMDAVAFFPILGLGLLFGWVYERTGSLAAPMAIHIFHNGGMLFVASVVKSLVTQG